MINILLGICVLVTINAIYNDCYDKHLMMKLDNWEHPIGPKKQLFLLEQEIYYNKFIKEVTL